MTRTAKRAPSKKPKPPAKTERLTPKQEAFAVAYVELGNAQEAYRQTYDVTNEEKSWIRTEAWKQLNNPNIAKRVSELQEQARQLALYTVKAAHDEYEDARKLAMNLEQPSAAISAVNGKVKLFGLEKPAKSEVDISGTVDVQDRSAIELARRLAFVLAKGVYETEMKTIEAEAKDAD